MNTHEIQAARKAAEREPRDWDTYRQALIDSGMVDEARQRRSVIVAAPSYAAVVEPAAPTFEYEPTLIDALYEEAHGDE